MADEVEVRSPEKLVIDLRVHARSVSMTAETCMLLLAAADLIETQATRLNEAKDILQEIEDKQVRDEIPGRIYKWLHL